MADNNSNTLSDEEFANAVFQDGDSLVVDLSNVEGMSFELVPKGTYDAEIEEVTFEIGRAHV